MSEPVRCAMEQRLGHDFSRVRVHTDAAAVSAARELGAAAFTSGADIAFASGYYAPGSHAGQQLLAHELAHVVQHERASIIEARVSRPGEASELAAGAAAHGQGRAAQTGGTVAAVQCQPLATAPPPAAGSGGGAAASLVPRSEVVAALTTWLYKVQGEQGGQTLHLTPLVRNAVLRLAGTDLSSSMRLQGWLNGAALPGDAAEFARAVGERLPDTLPRSQVDFLGTAAAKEATDTRPTNASEAIGQTVVDSKVRGLIKALPLIPEDWKDKIVKAAQSAVTDGILAVLDQVLGASPLDSKGQGAIHSLVEGLMKQKAGGTMDRQQDGAGSPYARALPPSLAPPPLPGLKIPGEHILMSPRIPWDFPAAKAPPKPDLPKAPSASEAQSVADVIAAIPDDSLIPAEARGKSDADNFGSAQELARGVARLLDQAQQAKRFSVDLTISMSYAKVADLRDIFDRIEDIVKKVAAALPHHASQVGQVIVSPALPSDKAEDSGKFKLPMRRIVHLNGN